MRTKHFVYASGVGLLWIVSAVFAQNLKSRVLIEMESLKVIGAETFPKDLECEIYVGPQTHPHFRTEGEHGRIKSAVVNASLSTAISVLRKDTQDESYALYFFSEDTDGKVFGLFDLNLDGQWDVKKSPTRKEKIFILFRGEWLGVEKLEGLLSKSPIALADGKQYRFNGTWALSQ